MAAPSTEVSWLPRPRTTPIWPQNLLRPSEKGCSACTEAAYRMPDSRRNMAGLAGPAQLGRLAGLDMTDPGVRTALYALSALSAGASAFHGYRRNRGSIGWALTWGFFGTFFPVITPAIAIAQGFGKPARR